MALPPKNVPVVIPSILGVPKKNILSFNIDASQFGATFTLNCVMANNESLSIAENSYISILPNVFGFVDDVVYNISPTAGKTYTITGRMLTPDMYNVKSMWYVTDQQFRAPGQIPHVSQAQDLVKTGAVKVIPNLNFLSLIQSICQDNGINFKVVGDVLNYKVFSYYLDATQDITQSLQALALQAGCNLVVRSGELVFIPWGAAYGNFTVGENSVTVDYKISTDTFPFKNLILKGSDEPTPWNAFYVGLPEKIASLNFEAGPISVKDISYGSGVVQPSKDWVFPEDGVNEWQTFSIQFSSVGTAGNPVMNQVSSTLGVDAIWDYTYLDSNAYDYRTMFSDLKSTKDSTPVNIDSVSELYKNGANPTYKGLLRWKNAYTVVSNTEDFHPKLYILPSDIAPDYPSFGTMELEDNQEIRISYDGSQESISGSSDFYQESQFINGVILPQEFGSITPNGYGITCKDSSGNDGFNPDGSFVLPLTFSSIRAFKKKIDEPGVMPKIYIENGFYTSLFTQATFTQGSTRVKIEFTDFAGQSTKSPHLADHIRKVMQRTFATVITPDRPGSSVLIPKDGPSVTAGEIGYRAETLADQSAFDPEDVWFNNSYKIVDVFPELNNDGDLVADVAYIIIYPPSRVTTNKQRFTFYREHHNHTVSPAYAKRSTTGTFTVFGYSSGLVAENSESIKGSWSAYGIRRKVFPTTVVNGQPFYFGISESSDIQNSAAIDAAKTKFTKNVTAQNITYNVGTNSDLVRLSTRILNYMFSQFSRSSRTYAPSNIEIPPIGALCKDGIIVSSSVSISDSGALITVNCGALPII